MAFDFFEIIKFSGEMAAKRQALLELVDFIHRLSEPVQEELIHTPKSSARRRSISRSHLSSSTDRVTSSPTLMPKSLNGILIILSSSVCSTCLTLRIAVNANISREFCIASRENSCCIVASLERPLVTFSTGSFFETQRSSGILQVLFLSELEEVLEATQAAEF
ncbi:hypothetical protein KFK09_015742 [Dendrobium nobile]|uniref:Uncharacterized protein n=1 Tax=Dendrobium nobile TaxID=94219 RepID=A0A8T3B7Q5_DENNO|nr:hypothetical protein KFK09_015742 [Dendrobium nobile]